MKPLNTPIINKKIKNALRKIKRNKIKAPSDGSFITIKHDYSRRGKWQIEYVHDKRMFARPYLAAFYFNGHSQCCRSADYFKYYMM